MAISLGIYPTFSEIHKSTHATKLYAPPLSNFSAWPLWLFVPAILCTESRSGQVRQHHSLQDRSSWLNLDHCLRTGFQHLHHIYRHQVGPSMQQESLSSLGTSKVTLSASLDSYPVPSSCKALVGGIRSWRTSFFCRFSFRLGNWLSSVQNLLPYLLYSQVDKGSHHGWGWAEWRTTPKSSQTRRSPAPVPPPWDLLVEPWRGQPGGRARKAEKGDPTCMLWMNQTDLGCCNVRNQIEADAATKLQDIASEVNSPRTRVPNTSR